MPRSAATRLMSIAVAACLGIALVPGSSLGQSLTHDFTRPVTLPYSQEYTLVSKLNDREYRISVALPFSYHVGEATDTARYPVLYLLDGDMSLPLFAGMFRLTNRGPSGDLILVGVGYPPGADPGVPAPGGGRPPYRLTDYTPPAYPASDSVNAALQKDFPGSEGAEVFLQVLKQEVIPFIDLRFRTTDDRGIHGHSYGGLFAA